MAKTNGMLPIWQRREGLKLSINKSHPLGTQQRLNETKIYEPWVYRESRID